MTAIYYLLTLALVLVHFAAVSALLSRWIPSFHIARAVGVLGIALAGYFVEHFQGFGRLTLLWPLTALASAVLLAADRKRLGEAGFLKAESVFWLLVGYGLLWKWCFPSIYPSSERVTDLYFIGNYLPGSTLPPLDNWYPPRSFDFYYAFQHYAAGLLGRLFDLSPGLTYNLAMPLLTGLTAALVWDFAGRFIARRAWQWLLVASFVIGGTGATPFVHLVEGDRHVDANAHMMGSARFVGLYDHQFTSDPFWRDVFLPPVPPGFERRELPMEGFGYQYYVGDYHPPLGGFFLLALALALIALLERGLGSVRLNTVLLGATVPLTIATNTWVFPLQALLVAGWMAWRHRKPLPGAAAPAHPPADWPAVIGGGLGAAVLIYPFLTAFAAKSQPTAMKLVQAIDHTPVAQFLALHWPMLVMIVLGLAVSLAKREWRGITLYFAVFLGLLLFASEMIHVDDPSGGKYERTNSVMKWWGWLWTACVIALGSLLLGSPSRWARWITGASLAVTCFYAADVVSYFRHTGQADRGQLHGAGVYTREPVVRDMFRYLADAPQGIVLENIYDGAYSDSGIHAAFAAKPVLLGWPMHLVTWHGDVPDVWLTRDAIVALYAGNLPDARKWLLARDVRYIVWSVRDAHNREAWSRLQSDIDASYAWHGFGNVAGMPVGLWVRR